MEKSKSHYDALCAETFARTYLGTYTSDFSVRRAATCYKTRAPTNNSMTIRGGRRQYNIMITTTTTTTMMMMMMMIIIIIIIGVCERTLPPAKKKIRRRRGQEAAAGTLYMGGGRPKSAARRAYRYRCRPHVKSDRRRSAGLGARRPVTRACGGGTDRRRWRRRA